jgi:hypothetical protein
MGGPSPEKKTGETKTEQTAKPTAMAEKVFPIDNFESGSLKAPRDWWVFDVKAEIVSTDLLKAGESLDVGLKSLFLSGPATSFYVGGMGTYLAKEGQDLSKYNAIQVDIYGAGADSGSLKIELYDDDNGNWQIEQDKTRNFASLYDDKWGYEVKIDWNGWKRVAIPMADFVDENPAVGDDIWNPQQNNNSGGMLQLQLICIATKSKGKVAFDLDNLALLTE